MGRGGSVEKEGVRVKWAGHNIYNLFRVSLFHSDETFHVYACTNIYNLFRVSLFHSDETFHVYACTGSAFFR